MDTKEIQIGYWTLTCCCQDAQEIRTQEDLDGTLETLKKESNREYSSVTTVYKTKEDLVQKDCSCTGTLCNVFGITKNQ